jgi:hypothetical protein
MGLLPTKLIPVYVKGWYACSLLGLPFVRIWNLIGISSFLKDKKKKNEPSSWQLLADDKVGRVWQSVL